MHINNTMRCLSFHAKKLLPIGRGGMILTDDKDAYEWFKKARFSGREECSYHVQKSFDMLGWNMYMNPIVSELGLLLMQQFYNLDGTKKDMPDLELPYPDLSKHPIYTQKHGISK